MARSARSDKRISLITKPQRQGKWTSLNWAFSVSQADILILLDADIRLANEEVIAALLAPLRFGRASLAGGNPVPRKPPQNAIERADYFGWVLVDRIRSMKPNSLYGAHGRILALSRELYPHIVLPDSSADDQYIYFSCISKGLKFAHAQDSVVQYALPRTLGDYLKQSVRFRFNNATSTELFGRDMVESSLEISHAKAVFLSAFIGHPCSGTMWAICYMIGKLRFQYERICRRRSPGMWDVATTAK